MFGDYYNDSQSLLHFFCYEKTSKLFVKKLTKVMQEDLIFFTKYIKLTKSPLIYLVFFYAFQTIFQI